jgi:hypothetical protein
MSILSVVAIGGVCGCGGDGGDAGVGVVDPKEDVAMAGAAPDTAGFVARVSAVAFGLGVLWAEARAG